MKKLLTLVLILLVFSYFVVAFPVIDQSSVESDPQVDIFRNFGDLVLPIDDHARAEKLGYGGDGTIHNVTSASNLGTTGRDRTWSTRATSAKS